MGNELLDPSRNLESHTYSFPEGSILMCLKITH